MKDLNKMFKPDSVAVIGASNTPGKVGYIIIDNIISGGYKGKRRNPRVKSIWKY